MTKKNKKLDERKELCQFYRVLAAVQIAAVDYVRGDEKEKDHLQRVAERANKATTELKKLMKKPGSSSDAQPIILSSEDEGQPATLQFLMQDDCADQNSCWDPVTKTCGPC